MDATALRERTRGEHEATEALLPLMSEHLQRREYIDVLNRFYAVLCGWEHWAEEHAPQRFRALLGKRRRSVLLERDLDFLGETACLPTPLAARLFEPLRAAVSGPEGDEHAGGGEVAEARFLGALYVVEGSTLGGQYIARHVERVLALTPGEGDAYFCGYGEHTGAMWREVKALLSEAPAGSLEETVAAAKCMFSIFAEGLAAKPFAVTEVVAAGEAMAAGASAGSPR